MSFDIFVHQLDLPHQTIFCLILTQKWVFLSALKSMKLYKLSAEWEILLYFLYSACLFNLKSLLHGDTYSLELNTVCKHWVNIKNVFVPRCSCDVRVICLLQDWSLGNRPGESAERKSWQRSLEPVSPVPGVAHQLCGPPQSVSSVLPGATCTYRCTRQRWKCPTLGPNVKMDTDIKVLNSGKSRPTTQILP